MSSDWRRHAACADTADPDLFVSPVTRDAAKVVAGRYCAQCPVRAACLEEGIAVNAEGVWGGRWLPGRSDRQPADLLAPRAAS